MTCPQGSIILKYNCGTFQKDNGECVVGGPCPASGRCCEFSPVALVVLLAVLAACCAACVVAAVVYRCVVRPAVVAPRADADTEPIVDAAVGSALPSNAVVGVPVQPSRGAAPNDVPDRLGCELGAVPPTYHAQLPPHHYADLPEE